MASYVTPKINTQYIFYVSLVSQANTKIMQSNPTIAAGDFKVSTDGGALVNLGTLPAVTPTSSKMVKVTLSAAEMNGDNVTVIASDASGAEWCDLVVNIQTSARQVDDLAYPTTSGRSIDVTATGAVGMDWGNVENPTTSVGLTNTTVGTVTTNSDMRGTDNALLAASAPTNFGDLAVTVTTGKVTVGTNDDKTGYSISGTKTTLDALNDLSAADVNAEVDAALDTAIPGVPTADSINERLATLDDAYTATRAGYLDNINNAALQTTTAQTGDSYARLGAPAGASVSADIAAVKTDTSAILTDTGTTLDAKLDDIQGATFDTATDSLEAIRNRGDAAWTTGGSSSNPALLQNTTIATLASQTSFTLTAGSADDNAYNDAIIVITDQTTGAQKAVGIVSDYTGATKTVTLAADPGIFTMAVGDTVDIIAAPKIINTVTTNSDMRGTDNAALAATALSTANWTAARAGYLDELAAANIPADVDAILTDTADMQPKLGTPAGTDMSADIAAVKADTAATLVDTADMQPKLGTPAGANISADIATVDANVDAILADTGTDGVVISTATAQAIADEILKRGVSNVEDAADAHSLTAIVLAALESSLSGATWTIKKTDGTTTFTTKTVTTDATADPVTAVT